MTDNCNVAYENATYRLTKLETGFESLLRLRLLGNDNRYDSRSKRTP